MLSPATLAGHWRTLSRVVRIAFPVKPYYLACGDKPDFKVALVTVLNILT
jgi:hypothetical protein